MKDGWQSAEAEELVVLCDDRGESVGQELKTSVHGRNTPLHLAFSCYVFDANGRFLVTRRASTKRTWPGIRTNSCCGHPQPGESMTSAIRRRLLDELGLPATAPELILPRFRYRATMPNDIKENELCPVYRVVVTEPAVTPDPAEVSAAWWQNWTSFLADASAMLDPLSPWSVEQIAALRLVGDEPLSWPTGDAAELPPAARAAEVC